jgi:hypothetical protein
MQDASQWAVEQFGAVELGDQRRTARAVEIAARMARRPGDTLPKQMNDWQHQKAAYRLLDNQAVDFEALSTQHWQQTRQRAGERDATVLMVQDITELDYSSHKATEGLGPIGDHRGRGVLVHNTLAVSATEGHIYGLAYQQAWIRDAVNHKQAETRSQRHQRGDKQSARWVETVNVIGKPPPGVRWVHVGDRECDIFDFFQAVVETKADFCVRILQNRRLVEWQHDDPRYLISDLRQLKPMGYRRLELAAKPGQPKRTAQLAVSWQPVTLRSPRNRPGAASTLTVWAVRTWEVEPPPDVEAVEWLLLTSIPVATWEDALERIDWYTHRWLVEEYHSCLKTGCSIEKSQLQHGERLRRLLGFMAILAVRLLQLRDWARSKPTLRAVEVVQPLLVQIMAYQTQSNPDTMTVSDFWRAVAQVGGFPGRTSDGQPGWKRLWHGWLRLLDWADGVRFAQNLPPLQDVGNDEA